MAITKTQRWLDLIAFLVKHRFPVDVEQVMLGVPAYREKWLSGDETRRSSARRMFERDKDELRAAGIPIETVHYSIEHGAEAAVGYRLSGRDFYLPYLRIVGRSASRPAAGGPGRPGEAADRGRASGPMEVQVTADEASLAMDALRRIADLPDSPFAAEARSALTKLRFDLEPPVVGEERGAYDGVADRLEASGPERPPERARVFEAAPVLFADPMHTGGVRETLRLLTDALHHRTRVRFRYHGIHRGQPTDRDVAPYGLLYQHGHWYLIGDDATRAAIRVFRLGRMEAVESSSSGPEYDIPADFDVADYAHRQPWELGEEEPLTADVRFAFPLSLWAERNSHGRAVEERAGGAVVRRFQVRQTDPFLRWLQSFAGDAIVVAPAELRRAQAELARETLEVHGG